MCGVVVSLVSVLWNESYVNPTVQKYQKTPIFGSVLLNMV